MSNNQKKLRKSKTEQKKGRVAAAVILEQTPGGNLHYAGYGAPRETKEVTRSASLSKLRVHESMRAKKSVQANQDK